MTTALQDSVAKLPVNEQRAVFRFARWVLTVHRTKQPARFEAVAGEGRIKAAHETSTFTVETM